MAGLNLGAGAGQGGGGGGNPPRAPQLPSELRSAPKRDDAGVKLFSLFENVGVKLFPLFEKAGVKRFPLFENMVSPHPEEQPAWRVPNN